MCFQRNKISFTKKTAFLIKVLLFYLRFGICPTPKRSTNPPNPPTIRSNPNRLIRHDGCRMKAITFFLIWKVNGPTWKTGSGLKDFSGFTNLCQGKHNTDGQASESFTLKNHMHANMLYKSPKYALKT